jgi:two-component system sensor histidine kinase QseC
MMRSLSARLLTGMVGSIALLLILFGIVVHVSIRRALLEEFDFTLASAAHTLAAAVEMDDEEIEVEFDLDAVPELQNTDHPLYFQCWMPDGTVLARSASLAREDLPMLYGQDGEPAVRAVTLADGRRLRALGLRFAPAVEDGEWIVAGQEHFGGPRPDEGRPDLPQLTLVLARDTAGLESQMRFVRWLLLATGAVTMVSALLVSVAVVKRGLEPLKSLAARIAAIGEEDLATRISARRMPTEMKPVAEKLNHLLARLETAFGRERAFTSDVAHELRTPLAGVRSTLEVALGRDRQAAEYKEALADSLAITERLEAMVESLLTLAQLDAGRMEFRREDVELRELVDACWSTVADTAQARGLSFANDVPADLSCTSDRDGLIMVFTNLLANAAEYADENGRVWVRAHEADDSVEVAVANTGSQLTPEQASQATERFWRADASRRDTGIHYGLGLALARRVVSSLGGTIRVEVDPVGVFTVRIAIERP